MERRLGSIRVVIRVEVDVGPRAGSGETDGWDWRRGGGGLDEIEIEIDWIVEIEEAMERRRERFEGVEVGEVGLRESVAMADRRFEKVRPLPAQRHRRQVFHLRCRASHRLCNCKIEEEKKKKEKDLGF